MEVTSSSGKRFVEKNLSNMVWKLRKRRLKKSFEFKRQKCLDSHISLKCIAKRYNGERTQFRRRRPYFTGKPKSFERYTQD